MKSNKERCINTDCIKVKWNDLKDIRVTPFEVDNEEIRKLFSYFLYRAPNIESAQSQRIPIEHHSALFHDMIDGRHYEYKKFCSFSAQIEKEFAKGHLNSDKICLKCKRFVCKKKKTDKKTSSETDLDCFLRHIRNSIAHGRVYYCHAGNKVHIMFEDKNTSGNLSARIVCIKADLIHWRSVLSHSSV